MGGVCDAGRPLSIDLQRPPHDPCYLPCLPVSGVDAVSEVVEHASEALAPLLVELALCLPPKVAQVRRSSLGRAASLLYRAPLFAEPVAAHI